MKLNPKRNYVEKENTDLIKKKRVFVLTFEIKDFLFRLKQNLQTFDRNLWLLISILKAESICYMYRADFFIEYDLIAFMYTVDLFHRYIGYIQRKNISNKFHLCGKNVEIADMMEENQLTN